MLKIPDEIMNKIVHATKNNKLSWDYVQNKDMHNNTFFGCLILNDYFVFDLLSYKFNYFINTHEYCIVYYKNKIYYCDKRYYKEIIKILYFNDDYYKKASEELNNLEAKLNTTL